MLLKKLLPKAYLRVAEVECFTLGSFYRRLTSYFMLLWTGVFSDPRPPPLPPSPKLGGGGRRGVVGQTKYRWNPHANANSSHFAIRDARTGREKIAIFCISPPPLGQPNGRGYPPPPGVGGELGDKPCIVVIPLGSRFQRTSRFASRAHQSRKIAIFRFSPPLFGLTH